MEEKNISISLKELYQMLVGTCRYGYTRNNHLMPADAYGKVKKFIPEMHKVDEEYALYTLKQICEECITEELNLRFYDGEDDEFGNRRESIKFINWCFDYIKEKTNEEWKPYCYDSYLSNLKYDDEPRYNVYEVKDGEEILLTSDPVSVKEFPNVVFEGLTEAIYSKIKVDSKCTKYLIHEPSNKEFLVKHI